MIDWLARHGVDEIVLACGFLADGLRDGSATDEAGGPRLRYVEEPEPRGTAGAIKFAERASRRPLPRPQRRRAHRPRPDRADRAPRGSAARARRWRCTRSTTRPPTGWSGAREDGEITEFLEKPDPAADRHRRGQRRRLRAREVRSSTSSRTAGTSRSSARSSRGSSATGSTRAARGLLDGHRHPRALPRRPAGTSSSAGSRPSRASSSTATGSLSRPQAEVADEAEVDAPALLEPRAQRRRAAPASAPRAVARPRLRVGEGATVEGSVLHRGCTIGRGARGDAARSSPAGSRSARRDGAAGAVIGAGARIAAGAEVEPDARVEPGGDGE